MQPALRHGANLLLAELRSGQLAPAMFQTKLNDVPAPERDEWLDTILQLDESPTDDPDLPRGCVPYLACPVALVSEVVQLANVTRDDVFVDVGSGTGRVIFLANLLTGASCVGLEIQPALVRASRECSARLNFKRTRFVEGDAVEQIRLLTVGTVFFLYCPFDQSRVDRVLEDLQATARTRQIRICCVHMPRIERPWLVRVPSPSVELEIYMSTDDARSTS